VVHSRMQDWGGVPGGFDIITSRAMMAFHGLHNMVSPFLAPHGVLLANILARIDERSTPAFIWRRRLDGDLGERSLGIFLGKVDNR